MNDTLIQDGIEIVEKMSSDDKEIQAYVGIDKKRGKLVFVKTLKNDSMHNEAFTEQFMQEYNILSVLQSGYTPKIIYHGMKDGIPYIVTDFVYGISLANVVMYQISSAMRSAELVRNIADAMEYIHSHGVVHLDLNPFNIIVTDDGAIKIVDFGISHFTRKKDSRHLQGTMSYIAPEILENASNISPQADIYSLGIVLYEVILGGFSNGVIDLAMVPMGVKDTIKKAIDRDPAKRFRSMKEFSESLNTFIHGDHLSKNMSERARKFFNINKIEDIYNVICPSSTNIANSNCVLSATAMKRAMGSDALLIREIGDSLLVCYIDSDDNNVVITSIIFGILLTYSEHVEDVEEMYKSCRKLILKLLPSYLIKISLMLFIKGRVSVAMSKSHVFKHVKKTGQIINMNPDGEDEKFTNVDISSREMVVMTSKNFGDSVLKNFMEDKKSTKDLAKNIAYYIAEHNAKSLCSVGVVVDCK